ncbi:hypothetical protein [Aeromonas phage AerS_266]|nr:hypothetical protein [Aeromonas phage AerS_266]
MKLANIETDVLIRELIDRGYQVSKIVNQRPPTPKPINRDKVLVISLESGNTKHQPSLMQCGCNHPLCPLCNKKRR